jgi:hypothetical protein
MGGKSGSALKDLEHALSPEPENTDILFALTLVCYRIDQFGRCQETLDLGLSIDDTNTNMLELQSELYFRRATDERLLQAKSKMADGLWNDAERICKEALALSPRMRASRPSWAVLSSAYQWRCGAKRSRISRAPWLLIQKTWTRVPVEVGSGRIVATSTAQWRTSMESSHPNRPTSSRSLVAATHSSRGESC